MARTNSRLITSVLAFARIAIPTDYQLANPEYPREVKATGTDLVIEPGQDFVVTTEGDLLVIEGVDLIRFAFLRRVTTSLTAYGRWVPEGKSGYKLLDETYGSKVYQHLSAPLTPSLFHEIRRSIFESAEADSRIIVESVEIGRDSKTNTQAGLNGVTVNLTYRIKGNAELLQLDTVLRPDFASAPK